MRLKAHEPAGAYAVLSQFYDLEYDRFDADLPLYDLYAGRAGGPILELGCGTGRILQSLAKHELPLTGIDSSPEMLRLARERLGGAATLINADMSAIADADLPNAPFSMAFASINTFLHLPDVPAQLSALSGTRTQMRNDGFLLLDIFTPDLQFFDSLASQVQHEFHITLQDGSRMDKWVSRTHDRASQIIENDIIFDITSPDGAVRRMFDHYTTRYVYLYELEHLLARTGWTIEQVFGDYDLSPYDAYSERMLIVAILSDRD